MKKESTEKDSTRPAVSEEAEQLAQEFEKEDSLQGAALLQIEAGCIFGNSWVLRYVIMCAYLFVQICAHICLV